MGNIIYNRELNEFKIDYLNSFKNDLENIKILRLRKKSNAYEELSKLILNVNNIIYELSYEIKKNDFLSTIKIENSVLDELLRLKKILNIGTISELLHLLATNYHNIFLIDKLTEIKDISINKNLELELIKMNFIFV
ncbi:hypothetical protein ACRCD8_09890 [Aliarcobacter sp. ERUVET-8]|uniref:hypothetical protein n=1 Tax=Aliarcobacter sp. ERUVET-8 TaxID=3429684 RepID=UPI003D6C166A